MRGRARVRGREGGGELHARASRFSVARVCVGAARKSLGVSLGRAGARHVLRETHARTRTLNHPPPARHSPRRD